MMPGDALKLTVYAGERDRVGGRLLADARSIWTRWMCLLIAAFFPGQIYFAAIFPISMCIAGMLACLYLALRTSRPAFAWAGFAAGFVAAFSYLTAIVVFPALLIAEIAKANKILAELGHELHDSFTRNRMHRSRGCHAHSEMRFALAWISWKLVPIPHEDFLSSTVTSITPPARWCSPTQQLSTFLTPLSPALSCEQWTYRR